MCMFVHVEVVDLVVPQHSLNCFVLLFFLFCLGDDAVKFESLPNNVVVAKAMAVLRSIFGDQTVPEVHLFFFYTSQALCVSVSLSTHKQFTIVCYKYV